MGYNRKHHYNMSRCSQHVFRRMYPIGTVGSKPWLDDMRRIQIQLIYCHSDKMNNETLQRAAKTVNELSRQIAAGYAYEQENVLVV